MKALNQFKTFERLLQAYPANVPLGKFLPGFFRQNKQMGSTDRKVASRLIYNYFRLGRAVPDTPVDERLFIAEFLCNNQINSFIQHFKPEWATCIDFAVDEKIAIIKKAFPRFNLEDVFAWANELSPDIDKEAFLKSLFVQPDLYIRIQKGNEQQVKAALAAAEIPFRLESENCLALPNGTKLDAVFPNQHFFEVQDKSSQQTAAYFQPKKWEAWWDACAASGGKSLLLHDLEPTVKLVVSDVRESILANLDERFEQAGILKYQKKLLDLTTNCDAEMHHYEFDGIILDAPCSGSGTWGRTPEMISQFQDHSIAFFQRLQRAIIPNVIKYLKPGQPLIYITCSAFEAENEANVNFMTDQLGMVLESQQVLKGYEHKADTMFVARLIRKEPEPIKEELPDWDPHIELS
ncbi:RsmB/NOP family class I SAM-dependent RNA methyltransferase [Mucilaginibacter ginkgonis]|uniref:RsmB/NOP family class I SAM-dependent RNA methyltransferase n=1 Tax=Mucilaginibacter ginkgonis TaxID=2682091 RepID=A0A6I4HUV5_9SPHI|nr:RsmB/NOP family class I SAM-dependent RNA methyltransferase [Mucilaginibacter ginkgonis]QQL50040.1 RsmB/NOP family class I SAM-dependent RNA methyltransferase [Mucilaginibacter ginkgonis]